MNKNTCPSDDCNVKEILSTSSGPDHRAISTVPLCSALFRQKFFPLACSSAFRRSASPHVVPPSGGPVSRMLSRLQGVPLTLFNFVQVCSGLFRLKNFSEKTLCSPLALLAVLAFKQNQESGFPYSAWSAYSAVNQFSDPQSQIPNPHDARI